MYRIDDIVSAPKRPPGNAPSAPKPTPLGMSWTIERTNFRLEFWHREGFWPVEDTRHGYRIDGLPHPIITPSLGSA